MTRNRIKRRDDNHAPVVQAMERVGATVKDTSQVAGFCDVVVGFRGETRLVEIKDGSKPPSARKLTPDESAFHEKWRGSPVDIVNSEDEAIALVRGMGV